MDAPVLGELYLSFWEKMIAKYRDRNRFGSIFQPEDVCD